MAAPRSAIAEPALRGELIDLLVSAPRASKPVQTDQSRRAPDHIRIQCVLFDVYGTLFVSASGDVGSSQPAGRMSNFIAALERADFAVHDEAVARHTEELYFAEIRRRHAADHVRGIAFPEVDIAEVWADLLQRLLNERLISSTRNSTGKQPTSFVPDRAALLAAAAYEALSNPVAPMPGMRKTIAAVAGSDIFLGIVSNAQFYTPLLFPAFLGQDHTSLGFRDDLCSWSYKVGEAKPSPRLFIPILERLDREGIAPESVLYVGNDMLNDVWTAQEAGCRTALFAGDRSSLRLRHDDPRCFDLQPDLVLLSLFDLLGPLGLGSAHEEKGKSR